MAPEQAPLLLPVTVVGMIDVGRLLRELNQLDGQLQEQSIRAAEKNQAAAQVQLPKLSLLLDQFVEQNHLDIRGQEDRTRAVEFLRAVRKDAPKIHMSFSANPSAQFMQKLTLWLRQNIHPQLLIAIGLQPNIGAGCVLRTTNKYFDMSLAKSFAQSRELLMQRLRTPIAGEQQEPVL